MVKGIGANEQRVFTRKVNGQKQEVTKINGKYFIKNSDGEFVEVEKTRKGSIFGKAQFSVKQQEQAAQKEITMEPVEFEFDKNGNLKKFINNEDGSKNEYIYDKNGNKIKFSFYDKNGNLSFYNTYEYDKNGNKTKISRYNADGTMECTTTEYDSSNRKIKEIDYNSNGTKSLETEYDTNGNRIRETSYDSNGDVEFITINDFNNNGRRVKETVNNPDGSLYYYNTYKYDDNGNEIKNTRFTPRGEAFTIENEYDSQNNEIKREYYDSDRNTR